MNIYESDLDKWGIDISEFMDLFGEPELDDEDNAFWVIDGTDTDPADGIPDVLAGLVTEPITTNPSQGGALG